MATKPVENLVPPDIARQFEVKELPQPGAAQAQGATRANDVASAEDEGKHKKKHRKHPKKKKEVAKVAATESVEGMAGPGSVAFPIPNRRPTKDPIWVGEKVWMDVTWLNTKAGEFEIETLPFKVMNGRKVYDFKGTARTSELFSLVYKAEDFVESFVDYEGFFPYKFLLHGDETKHIRNNLELFDHGAKKQYVAVYDNRLKQNEIHEDKGFKDLTPFSQDSLSAIFYVRTLPFEVGKTLRFPMTTNGSQWETEVTVLGREDVETKMGYIKAFKTKVETRFKGVMQQQGDAFMWFTDDERKFIVRFEAKVKIGWVAGIAKKIEPGMPELPASASPVVPAAAKEPEKSTQYVPPGGKKRMWFHNLIESISSGVKKKD